MKLFKTALLAGLAALLSIAPVAAAERAIIVLDASGSMWAQIDGQSRIAIARETLKTVVDTLPGDIELGLMAYGHRKKGDCNDIELLVPPGPDTGAQIIKAADDINPKGMTPISAAVQKAAEDLEYTEEPATVILITDGLENCEADPCALATELKAKGIDFTTHVLGFGLTVEEGEKVKCLAENTGGKYLSTQDAKELTAALTTTVQEIAQADTPQVTPPPETPPAEAVLEYNFTPHLTLSDGGPIVGNESNVAWEFYPATANGGMGERSDTQYGATLKANVPPGDYIIRAIWDYAHVDMPVTITADTLSEPTFVLDAGTVRLHPRPAPDAEIDSGAAVIISLPEGETTTYYGDTTAVVPAGPQSVTVEIGTGSATETFDLAAGETVDKDIIVGVGHTIVNAYYTDDISDEMKVTDGNLSVEVLKAKKKLDGSRETITTSYGPDTGYDLPPGDYIARLTLGSTTIDQPFTSTTGELTEVNAVLNAGVLYISAPGSDLISITGDKKDIQGKYKDFGYNYDVEYQTTLPAGHYLITARMPNDAGEMTGEATVTAGERTEVTLDGSEQ